MYLRQHGLGESTIMYKPLKANVSLQHLYLSDATLYHLRNYVVL